MKRSSTDHGRMLCWLVAAFLPNVTRTTNTLIGTVDWVRKKRFGGLEAIIRVRISAHISFRIYRKQIRIIEITAAIVVNNSVEQINHRGNSNE